MPRQTTDRDGGKLAGASVLATALTTVTQPVWVLDRDGLIRVANPAAAATLGYPDAGELLGRDGHDTVHADQLDAKPHPAWECPLLRPRTTGETVTSELDRFVRRDGSTHPRRHGLGAFTSRPAAGAFSRPGTNAPSFRQNDTVARSILSRLAALQAAAQSAPDPVAS